MRAVEDRYSNATLIGFYYGDVKADKIVNADDKVYVTVIFETKGWWGGTYNINTYDLKRMPDGSLDYQIGDTHSLYNGYESLNDSYNYTKVA